jgi:hypothetical protein
LCCSLDDLNVFEESKRPKKKKRRAKKSKVRKDALDTFEHINIEDEDAAEKQVEEASGGADTRKMNPAQAQMYIVMKSLAEEFLIGRTTMNPSKLLSPPEESAARQLITHQVTAIIRDLEQKQAGIGAKELILFLRNVSDGFASEYDCI